MSRTDVAPDPGSARGGRQPLPPLSPGREAVVSKTVLVADDTAANRQLLDYLLGVGGYRVVLADDADSGYAAAHRERPDLAIIDVHMPGGGTNLARKIRSDPALAHIPLIAVSSDGREVPDGVTDAGFDAYLPLPIEAETIVEVLGSIVAGGDLHGAGTRLES
jgi:CheY-like chemotaxis protein